MSLTSTSWASHLPKSLTEPTSGAATAATSLGTLREQKDREAWRQMVCIELAPRIALKTYPIRAILSTKDGQRRVGMSVV